MPTKDELKQYAASNVMSALTADIPFNGNTYSAFLVNLAEWVGQMDVARGQDPEAMRTVAIQNGSIYDSVEMSNADFIVLVEGILVGRQKALNAYGAAVVAIDNETITETGDLDTAWDNSITNYVPPTELPTMAELAEAISEIPATFDDLTDGSTNKAYTGTEKSKLAGVEAGAINTGSVNTLIATAISNLVNGAPSQLDTINELAAALGNDPNLASTLTTALAGKSSKSSFSALSNVSAHGISNAAVDAPADAPTNYNVVTTLLGALVGAVNDANTKQNAIATKYNDLADKFNTLLGKVTELETAVNNLKGAGEA